MQPYQEPRTPFPKETVRQRKEPREDQWWNSDNPTSFLQVTSPRREGEGCLGWVWQTTSGLSVHKATLCFVKPHLQASGSLHDRDCRGASKQAEYCSGSLMDPGGTILGPDSSSWLSNSQSFLPHPSRVRGLKKIPKPWPLDHQLVTGLRLKLMGEKCLRFQKTELQRCLQSNRQGGSA